MQPLPARARARAHAHTRRSPAQLPRAPAHAHARLKTKLLFANPPPRPRVSAPQRCLPLLAAAARPPFKASRLAAALPQYSLCCPLASPNENPSHLPLTSINKTPSALPQVTFSASHIFTNGPPRHTTATCPPLATSSPNRWLGVLMPRPLLAPLLPRSHFCPCWHLGAHNVTTPHAVVLAALAGCKKVLAPSEPTRPPIAHVVFTFVSCKAR